MYMYQFYKDYMSSLVRYCLKLFAFIWISVFSYSFYTSPEFISKDTNE